MNLRTRLIQFSPTTTIEMRRVLSKAQKDTLPSFSMVYCIRISRVTTSNKTSSMREAT